MNFYFWVGIILSFMSLLGFILAGNVQGVIVWCAVALVMMVLIFVSCRPRRQGR